MGNYSENTIKTKLFKESNKLDLEFVYETTDFVFFSTENDGLIYWLKEDFKTGNITISNDNGEVFEKSERLLNLFRLKI